MLTDGLVDSTAVVSVLDAGCTEDGRVVETDGTGGVVTVVGITGVGAGRSVSDTSSILGMSGRRSSPPGEEAGAVFGCHQDVVVMGVLTEVDAGNCCMPHIKQ